MSLRDEVIRRIAADGPMPFARYMDLALYHSDEGYYARADRRSGRAGDFFTSVDLGPLFGELLATQLEEMWQVLRDGGATWFHLVEAAAGNGRLSRDILDHAARSADFYRALRLTLVERSPTARAAHTDVLHAHLARLDGSADDPPDDVTGVIFANELLDALPVSPIVMTARGLREVYVDRDASGLVERLGPPSPTVIEHVAREGIQLETGWRAEVCPAAVDWVTTAATRLSRGFLVLIDYGHEAAELYSAGHANGTLTTYRDHRVGDVSRRLHERPPWLADPGACDITAHVDLTAVRHAAERAGLRTLAVIDQTYFLLGLGATMSLDGADDSGLRATKRRLALKTLLVPGGLGSTHKVMIFGKQVGEPVLAGCSFSVRAT